MVSDHQLNPAHMSLAERVEYFRNIAAALVGYAETHGVVIRIERVPAVWPPRMGHHKPGVLAYPTQRAARQDGQQ